MACTCVRSLVFASLATAVLPACANRSASFDLAASTNRYGPYDSARRVETYLAVDAAAVAAIGAARREKRTVVATSELPGDQGRLELASFRSDRRPDQFAVFAKGQKDTHDFGYLFDLDGDGRFDWVVFVGGPMRWSGSRIGWMDYHWIDTDGDGRVDVMVLNAIDLDGDHIPEEGVTAWLYDRNHDGLLDDGEYLGPFGSRPLERNGDALVVATWSGEKRISTKDPEVLGTLSALLQRMNAASKAER